MAYQINAAECAGCGGCEADCPNRAIRMKGDAYYIDPAKCTECKGFFPVAQCVQACVSDCISLA
ncbi:MAG: 4Fe-4S binding protein [Rhodospirillales bacterium]|jgi:ferredoxin|nr:4Fe-4S binding protein [Rhodospirillales bacterium]